MEKSWKSNEQTVTHLLCIEQPMVLGFKSAHPITWREIPDAKNFSKGNRVQQNVLSTIYSETGINKMWIVSRMLFHKSVAVCWSSTQLFMWMCALVSLSIIFQPGSRTVSLFWIKIGTPARRRRAPCSRPDKTKREKLTKVCRSLLLLASLFRRFEK